jgi:hypothetical protein
VLAVKVDYKAGQATIGTEKGRDVPRAEVGAALKSIGYAAEFSSEPPLAD